MEYTYLTNKARNITKVLIVALPGLTSLVLENQIYASQNNLSFSANYEPKNEKSIPDPKSTNTFQYSSLAILPEQIRISVKRVEYKYHK